MVDYDRHNNSYTKLRDKKEKSLSDEKVPSLSSVIVSGLSIVKAIFRIEQDFEIASADYEQHNTALKTELPQFFALATAFITPLFESFYYMQCQSSCEIRLYLLILAILG